MADNGEITWQVLNAHGYAVVDLHYFGKKGVLLSPNPKPPKDLKHPMKEPTVFKLQVIDPEKRQGEIIETVEQLETL